MERQQDWTGSWQMFKHGKETVIEWMQNIYGLTYEEGKEPNVWTKTIIIPVYKGKGRKSERENYRSINLLTIVRKIHGKIAIEWVKITENRISKYWSCSQIKKMVLHLPWNKAVRTKPELRK